MNNQALNEIEIVNGNYSQKLQNEKQDRAERALKVCKNYLIPVVSKLPWIYLVERQLFTSISHQDHELSPSGHTHTHTL